MWVFSQNTLEFSWMERRAMLLRSGLADLPWVWFDELGAFPFSFHRWLRGDCDSTRWETTITIVNICCQDRCGRWDCCSLGYIILWIYVTVAARLRVKRDKFALIELLWWWMWVHGFLWRHYNSCFQYIIITFIICKVSRRDEFGHFLLTINHLCV